MRRNDRNRGSPRIHSAGRVAVRPAPTLRDRIDDAASVEAARAARRKNGVGRPPKKPKGNLMTENDKPLVIPGVAQSFTISGPCPCCKTKLTVNIGLSVPGAIVTTTEFTVKTPPKPE